MAEEDSHLTAPWGMLLQPQQDPYTVQPRGFSRRLFLKGVAATAAVAAMPRALTLQQPATTAARNLGPMVNTYAETSLAMEDYNPLTRSYSVHFDRLKQEYEKIHGRSYENLHKNIHEEIDAKATEAAEMDALEEYRKFAASILKKDPDKVTKDELLPYLDAIDPKEEAIEAVTDPDEHTAVVEAAIQMMKEDGYTDDELKQLTYEMEEDSIDLDSRRWHGSAHAPWKIRGPAKLVHELLDRIEAPSGTVTDDDGNELTDDLSIPEELAKIMSGRANPAQSKAIKDYLEPGGPDPLDRVKSVDHDELVGKISKSIRNFLAGKTVSQVYQATQKGESGETEKEVRNLDQAIREVGERLQAPITVYRPLAPDTVPKTSNATGKHLHDQTFLTGTTDLDRAMSLVQPGGDLMAVEVQPGAMVLKDGDNVILPRHTKVHIHDHATVGDGLGVIKGKVHPQD